MKINGRTQNETFVRQLAMPRPDGSRLVLAVKPLPLGFQRRLRSHGIAPPAPPTRVARGSDGRPLRDAQGLAVLVPEEHDRDYLAEVELYHQRVAVLVAAEALAADCNIEFESQKPAAPEEWPRYADGLHREFAEAGWSDGDLIWLCDQVCRMSNLVDEHLEESRQNFSRRQPQGASARASNSRARWNTSSCGAASG